MSKKIKWEEMFPDEFLEIQQENPICYMAYGLAEPHGTYNALGLDWLKATALCEKTAEKYGGIIAPPFAWHVNESPTFKWLESKNIKQSLCSSIPADLFLRTVIHQLRAFDARDFHAAILITGHYGGLEQDMRLLCDYYIRRTGSPMQIHAIADYECIEYKNYKGDHAGMCETQQLMSLHPNLVDLEKKEPSPISGPWAGIDFYNKTKLPTRKEGDKIVKSQISHLGKIKNELLEKYHKKNNYIAPNQIEVDEMWNSFERHTRKFWVLSMTMDDRKQGRFPQFPGWKSLGI